MIIRVPIRPFSLNAERSEHRYQRAQRVSDTRFAAKIATLQEMRHTALAFTTIEIEVWPWALNQRFRQDIGNCYPSAKACIDGLVDAHLITDDTPEFLTRLTFRPHQFGRDEMELRICASS